MTALELDAMQGLIARGYGTLPVASYVLLGVDDAARARGWLDSVRSSLTSASDRPTQVALNLALTMPGLRALGVSDSQLATFSHAFRTGMTSPHRRAVLGDVGDAAPEHWHWGGPATRTVDAVLLVYARDTDTLSARLAALRDDYATGGLVEIMTLESVVDLDGREHFGFADGISQPTIEGLSDRVDTPPNTIRAGEFILGYRNEYDQYTDAPSWARNGTYLIFRQLSQDVRAFWHYLDSISDSPTHREWLAAKMVGRWPSGAPVTLTPHQDDALLSTANDFTYHLSDQDGLRCPVGAHVRRAHPRDSLDPDPGTARSVAVDKHHRLLRRGREYGPPVDDRFAPAPPDDPDRGLYFISLGANITRQFEFIQRTWLNNPHFGGLYDDPDPLIGTRSDDGAAFTIPADPARQRVHGIPRVVTPRGGAYFFLPSLPALTVLARRA